MAVADIVRRRGESINHARVNAAGVTAALAALSFSILIPVMGRATVIADPSAPGNQRPTVLMAPNDVLLVNIQTPSDAGVSRNVYTQFDVQRQGVILNNSRSNVQTQLGGWVQGNPWLATGNARVILNEVNSSRPSDLGGYIEVAGQRAQVVVANPSGVTCSDCGFINADRATITTGAPIINGGSLDGYRVAGGVVAIAGANGLDTGTADYTDIIAQSVQVNAKIWAQELKITTGVNEVNAAHTQTTAATADTGDTPAYAIDVAQFGGMYAGKITLVGTQSGVGVRHAGEIGASAGDVVITADGRIESRGSIRSDAANVRITSQRDITHSGGIESAGDTRIAAQGDVTNSGVLHAENDIAITAKGDVSNSGDWVAKANIAIVADGANSRISGAEGSMIAAGVQADGGLADHGDITVQATDAVSLGGKSLSGGDQRFSAGALSLLGAVANADTITLAASQGDIDLSGSTVVVDRTLALTTPTTLTTDSAAVSADALVIQADALSNVGGELKQTGDQDLVIQAPGGIDNLNGDIAVNSANLTLRAATLTNTDAKLTHAGDGRLVIDVMTLAGQQGHIATNGDLQISAETLTLNDAATTSRGNVTLESVTFNHRQGALVQTGTGVIKASRHLDNTGGMLAGNGSTVYTVGDLTNPGGVIQVTGADQSLTINATGTIDNAMRDEVKGDIHAAQHLTITAAELNTQGGEINAGADLGITTTGGLNNTAGAMAANQHVTVRADAIDNRQGAIGSINADVSLTATGGALDNSQGRIEAGAALNLTAQGLNNTAGVLLGRRHSLNSNGLALNNQDGQIVATDTLTLTGGGVNNDRGLMQAAAALAIDTNGQTLTNTNAGEDRGIIGGSAVTLNTGDVDNRQGYIGSSGNLSSTGQRIDNTENGVLLSGAQMHLTADALDNHGGRIQSAAALTVDLGSGQLDNTASLIRSGAHADITAGAVLNSNTSGPDKGLEADSLNARVARTVDNADGVIRAEQQLILTVDEHIDNTRGYIASKDHTVTLQSSDVNNKTLSVTNTDGTLIAENNLKIDSAALTGDGNVLSHGDMAIQLTAAYTHTGRIYAQGNAKIHTAGDFENQSKLIADASLELQASTINVQADSELKASEITLTALDADTLNNRGLIDGENTQINAVTLNNLGAGRIYGDHLSINAGEINNSQENGATPVIAARDRLDIAAQMVNNIDHALIFSSGDLAIGGALNADRHATGQAGALNNHSATLEALGDMFLFAEAIHNVNDGITTDKKRLPPRRVVEYQLNRSRLYRPKGKPIRYKPRAVRLYRCRGVCIEVKKTGDKSTAFTKYVFKRLVSETVVTGSDPAKILAGDRLHMNAGVVENDKSEIVAAGDIVENVDNLNNTDMLGRKVIVDLGIARSFRRVKNPCGCGFKTITKKRPYTPAPVVKAISILPAVYQANTAVSGTGAQVAAYAHDAAMPDIVAPTNVNAALRTAQTAGGVMQVTENGPRQADGVQRAVLTDDINRQVVVDSLSQQRPNAPNDFLVETAAAFTNYRDWISSQYVLDAVSIDPVATQQRLGDDAQGQRQVREQAAVLTGRRFLEGYSNNEQQYRQLVQDGALYAQPYQLRPGVDLSPEQMAQLTTDILWLVEKTVTRDGETTQTLTPQLYVQVDDGDLSATGGLIAVDDTLALNISRDLNDMGAVAGRRIADVNADNILNLGSAAQDAAVDRADQASAAQGDRSRAVDRVAGLYVSNTQGLLGTAAGHDLILKTTGAQSSDAIRLQQAPKNLEDE